MDTGRIEMCQMDMPKYRLGTVTSINPADDKDACHKDIQYPPPYILIEENWGKEQV